MGSERRIPARQAGLIVAVVALVAACSSDGQGATTSTTTLVAGSAGCDESPIAAGQTRVDLGDRWYLRHVPPAHDGTHPLPLVVDLHGYVEGAAIHTQTSNLGPTGDTKGFVTVTPQGAGKVPSWQVGIDTADTAFIDRVVDDVEGALCIDEDRVYVAGLSLGAFMTSALACSGADRFAAVATVAGIRDIAGCSPSRAVPVIAFHGTADPIVAYEGGYGEGVADLPNGSGGSLGRGLVDATKDEPSIEEIATAWAGRNGCDAEPADDAVAADVTLLAWPCPLGAEVELYRIADGGHTWPGSAFSRSIERFVGHTTMSVSASEAMWAFFVAHPLHHERSCTTPPAGTKQVTLGERWYRRHVPDVEGALPLVVDLHGFSEGADRAATVTGFESLGDEQGFVTVTPQGAGPLPTWDLDLVGPDVTFIGDMLDDVEDTVCIDPRRVYVAGQSMGGFFLSTLACSPLADRVAAWAPVAGMRDVPSCDAAPEPVLVQHGTGDQTVLYAGGLGPDTAALLGLPADGPAVPDLTSAWAARNGCGGEPPVERTDGSITWISHPCDVELRRIEGGRHEWPVGGQDVIWRFFEAHAR